MRSIWHIASTDGLVLCPGPMRIGLGMGLLVALTACGSSSDSANDNEAEDRAEGSHTVAERADASASERSVDSGATRSINDVDAGAANSNTALDGGTSTNGGPDDAPPSRDYPSGDPGCGLDAAAFCDTFDEIAPEGLPEGRSGDLDPRRYAGERAQVTN